jgi:[protein-PII] uridylyltransferase
LIEIVAEDRPGLLYDLARTMSEQGCNIEVVLIDTEAHKALDVFYVSKIGGEVQARLKSALVAACLAS